MPSWFPRRRPRVHSLPLAFCASAESQCQPTPFGPVPICGPLGVHSSCIPLSSTDQVESSRDWPQRARGRFAQAGKFEKKKDVPGATGKRTPRRRRGHTGEKSDVKGMLHFWFIVSRCLVSISPRCWCSFGGRCALVFELQSCLPLPALRLCQKQLSSSRGSSPHPSISSAHQRQVRPLVSSGAVGSERGSSAAGESSHVAIRRAPVGSHAHVGLRMSVLHMTSSSDEYTSPCALKSTPVHEERRCPMAGRPGAAAQQQRANSRRAAPAQLTASDASSTCAAVDILPIVLRTRSARSMNLTYVEWGCANLSRMHKVSTRVQRLLQAARKAPSILIEGDWSLMRTTVTSHRWPADFLPLFLSECMCRSSPPSVALSPFLASPSSPPVACPDPIAL